MRRRKLWFLLLLFIGTVPNAFHVSAQEANSSFLERPISLRLSKATIILAASTLAVEKHIPVGLQMSSSRNNEPNIDIDVRDVPLVEVLNMIAQQTTVYGWEYRDGVINFFPTRDSDSFFKKLLETRIARFVPNSNDKFEIREAILNLPEVKEVMNAEKVKAYRLGYIHYPSIYANNADLSTQHTDVRSLLNKIIRESEHNVWVLSWSNKNGREFELGF
jgi:hypothetical protein